MGDGTIPSVDLLGGEIRVVNDRSQSDQSWPTCGCCGQRESEDESDQRELNTKLHLALDQMVGRSERLLRQAQPQIVVKLNIWDQEFRLSIYWQIGVMIARLFWSTAHEAEMRPVIAPKKDRKYQRNANQDWYQMRPRVENAFWHLKWWSGIATG